MEERLSSIELEVIMNKKLLLIVSLGLSINLYPSANKFRNIEQLIQDAGVAAARNAEAARIAQQQASHCMPKKPVPFGNIRTADSIGIQAPQKPTLRQHISTMIKRPANPGLLPVVQPAKPDPFKAFVKQQAQELKQAQLIVEAKNAQKFIAIVEEAAAQQAAKETGAVQAIKTRTPNATNNALVLYRQPKNVQVQQPSLVPQQPRIHVQATDITHQVKLPKQPISIPATGAQAKPITIPVLPPATSTLPNPGQSTAPQAAALALLPKGNALGTVQPTTTINQIIEAAYTLLEQPGAGPTLRVFIDLQTQRVGFVSGEIKTVLTKDASKEFCKIFKNTPKQSFALEITPGPAQQTGQRLLTIAPLDITPNALRTMEAQLARLEIAAEEGLTEGALQRMERHLELAAEEQQVARPTQALEAAQAEQAVVAEEVATQRAIERMEARIEQGAAEEQQAARPAENQTTSFFSKMFTTLKTMQERAKETLQAAKRNVFERFANWRATRNGTQTTPRTPGVRPAPAAQAEGRIIPNRLTTNQRANRLGVAHAVHTDQPTRTLTASTAIPRPRVATVPDPLITDGPEEDMMLDDDTTYTPAATSSIPLRTKPLMHVTNPHKRDLVRPSATKSSTTPEATPAPATTTPAVTPAVTATPKPATKKAEKPTSNQKPRKPRAKSSGTSTSPVTGGVDNTQKNSSDASAAAPADQQGGQAYPQPAPFRDGSSNGYRQPERAQSYAVKIDNKPMQSSAYGSTGTSDTKITSGGDNVKMDKKPSASSIITAPSSNQQSEQVAVRRTPTIRNMPTAPTPSYTKDVVDRTPYKLTQPEAPKNQTENKTNQTTEPTSWYTSALEQIKNFFRWITGS